MNGAGASKSAVATFDVESVRADFPVLQREVHGKPLVYLDTAASAQRPLAVIEAVEGFYRNYNANIHRGVHTLSQEATEAHEQARAKIAQFINAPTASESSTDGSSPSTSRGETDTATMSPARPEKV